MYEMFNLIIINEMWIKNHYQVGNIYQVGKSIKI